MLTQILPCCFIMQQEAESRLVSRGGCPNSDMCTFCAQWAMKSKSSQYDYGIQHSIWAACLCGILPRHRFFYISVQHRLSCINMLKQRLSQMPGARNQFSAVSNPIYNKVYIHFCSHPFCIKENDCNSIELCSSLRTLWFQMDLLHLNNVSFIMIQSLFLTLECFHYVFNFVFLICNSL